MAEESRVPRNQSTEESRVPRNQSTEESRVPRNKSTEEGRVPRNLSAGESSSGYNDWLLLWLLLYGLTICILLWSTLVTVL